jgi:xanthine dehydrogenase molybdenum-binding subunit
LYAKILRSPHAHARIRDLDVSRAEALRGVKAVLTYRDPEIVALKPTNFAWTPFFSISYDRMLWPSYMDRKILSDHVRWVGDGAGVVVAAESEEIANEALELLDIEWDVLPFVLDPIEAMLPDAPVIHPEINPDGNRIPTSPYSESDVFIDRGDAEKALDEAYAAITATSHYHNAEHACLGTRGCLMTWKNDELTCWTSYYQADQTRMHITQMLDLPLDKVRVINPYIGGSFGRGNVGEQGFFIFTALLAQRTGQPILHRYTRREDFHDTRTAVSYECKMGADNDGKITACHFKSIGDSGAYVDHSIAAVDFVPKEFAESTLAPIPNLKMETVAAYTNKIPGGCMRGIGNNQINLVFGIAIDKLAKKLDVDPIELCIMNFGHEWGSVPDKSLEAVLRTGASKIDWGRRNSPCEGPFCDGPIKRGIGFSFHNSWHAAWQEMPRGHIQVSIKVNPDGTVILDAPTAETGPGSNSCSVFACAEALSFLGVSPDDITWISKTDTQRGLKDQVQTDSGVSYCHAEMMPRAAAKIREQVLELAAPGLEVQPGELEIEDGQIFVKGEPDRGLTVKELFWSGDLVPILATVSETLSEEVTGTPFCATFVEVEVDTETGQVKVLKSVVINDPGTVMYASGAEGQQIGGQAMAIGETLTEEIVYDRATGVPLNFNWVDYKIPTMLDVPDVEPVLLEEWKGAGEYGACGIGESVTTCGPAAIANAVRNAIGVRVCEIPITPEKILKALAEADSMKASE